MKNYIKNKLTKLPRPFRVWWGKCFLYMLGEIGTNEWVDDMVLYNKLELWVKSKGRPYTNKQLPKEEPEPLINIWFAEMAMKFINRNRDPKPKKTKP